MRPCALCIERIVVDRRMKVLLSLLLDASGVISRQEDVELDFHLINHLHDSIA